MKCTRVATKLLLKRCKKSKLHFCASKNKFPVSEYVQYVKKSIKSIIFRWLKRYIDNNSWITSITKL